MFKSPKVWLLFSLYSLILATLAFLIDSLLPTLVHEEVYNMIIFFFLLTLITHHFSVAALDEGHDRFSLAYFGFLTLRLLLSLSIILIALLLNIPDKITFIVNFALVYLAFLIFEIYALLTTLRSNFEKRAENAENIQGRAT
jgi:hypothetical protein